MDYRDYKYSRNLAWEILLREGVNELPVRTGVICKNMGIVIKEYESKEENDGFCLIRNGVPYIVVKKNCSIERKRFTVAHELGHILCGHVGKFELVNREPSPRDNPVEQAANVFASRLLAPACVLWGCGVRCADDIMKLCQISKTAAEYRMERIKVLLYKNKFLSSPLERRVYAQFEEFIEKNKIKCGK